MSIVSLAEQANPWWRDAAQRPPGVPPRRRALQRTLVERLVAEPRRATVVRGPRQVGKTTMLLQCIADLLGQGWPAANVTYFDFSDERFLVGSSSPRELAEYHPPGSDESRPRLLLLDEVTRAASWDSWLKQVVDARTHRILVTDSSASLLRTGATESGVGRWDVLEVEGLTYREFLDLQAREGEEASDVERRLPAAFERYLTRGGFPEHMADDSLLQVWSRLRDDISGKAIRKDLAVANVDTERVNHVFQYLLESSGSIADLKALAANAGAAGQAPDQRSLRKWLDLLEGTLLIRRLDRYAVKASTRLRARAAPRYYAADHGLIMAFAVGADPDQDPDVRGRAFEALAYRHLRAVEGARGRIGFYRGPKGDDEIDFVIELSKGRAVAIEVKHSRTPRSGDVDALRARGAQIGARSCVLLYGGPQVEQRDGVCLVPMREFALNPARWLEL